MLNVQTPGRRLRRLQQRGLSLVELMVGIAVGMFVVAAASTVITTQLLDNRRLMLEVQVQQDLRAAADIIARDLRRADSWFGQIEVARNGVWSAAAAAVKNPVQTLPIKPLDIVSPSEVHYYAARESGAPQFGFKLEGNVIKSLMPDAAGWQALTDDKAVRVEGFVIDEVGVQPPVQAVCTQLCPGGGQACWPTLQVRAIRVRITGVSTTDASVRRSIESVIRKRNDVVLFNDPANPTAACPT